MTVSILRQILSLSARYRNETDLPLKSITYLHSHYDENIQNFYYQRNAVTYNNNTPVIDCTKQIIEDTEKDNNSGTTWHDWKAATKKDNTCNYTDLDTTSQPAPNIWNISMPLLGNEIETQ